MAHGNIGEELERALSGGDSPADAEISRKILIISFLSMNPCSTSTRVATFLRTSERGVHWHMDGLIKEGIVGRYGSEKARFFLKDHVREGDCGVFSLLSDERIRRILLLLEEEPGMNQTDLMREISISRQSLKRMLHSLEGEELVKSMKEGRNRRFYLTGRLGELREEYLERRDAASEVLKEIMKRMVGDFEIVLERDGLLHIRVGKQDLSLSEDPFMSAFMG